MRRSVPSILIVAAVAATLSGCYDVNVASLQHGGATWDQHDVSPGTVVSQPPGQTLSARAIGGSFSLTLPAPAAAAARRAKLKVTKGTYVAQYDGQEDFSVHVASAKGYELATFADKASGSLCLAIDFQTSDHGVTYTGHFSTAGGTGRAARIRGAGSFTETASGTQRTASADASLTVSKKAVAMAAGCKAIPKG